MRISDWSSDVCSSDLDRHPRPGPAIRTAPLDPAGQSLEYPLDVSATLNADPTAIRPATRAMIERLIAFDTTSRNSNLELIHYVRDYLKDLGVAAELVHDGEGRKANRSEEHTSELQSLMRNSYAVFCLTKKQ